MERFRAAAYGSQEMQSRADWRAVENDETVEMHLSRKSRFAECVGDNFRRLVVAVAEQSPTPDAESDFESDSNWRISIQKCEWGLGFKVWISSAPQTIVGKCWRIGRRIRATNVEIEAGVGAKNTCTKEAQHMISIDEQFRSWWSRKEAWKCHDLTLSKNFWCFVWPESARWLNNSISTRTSETAGTFWRNSTFARAISGRWRAGSKLFNLKQESFRQKGVSLDGQTMDSRKALVES